MGKKGKEKKNKRENWVKSNNNSSKSLLSS